MNWATIASSPTEKSGPEIKEKIKRRENGPTRIWAIQKELAGQEISKDRVRSIIVARGSGSHIRAVSWSSPKIRVSSLFDLNSEIGKIRRRFRAIIGQGKIVGRFRLYFDFQF